MYTKQKVREMLTGRRPMNAGQLVIFKDVLKIYEDLVIWLLDNTPPTVHRERAIDKILESKDAAVVGLLYPDHVI